MTELFLDTSFAIALVSSTDKHHARAEELAEQIEAQGTRLVTTKAVLLEIGNALSKQRFRRAAVELLESLESDPKVDIVALSDSLYRRGFGLFSERADKEWSLTDCLAFVVMKDRGLTDALTTDEHFRQAGFRPMLLE
jgi:predicted nucleic acid-binding protein